MELSTLQGQLKVAIQNHQITVAKMKSDPQNSSLQKRLHELQAEIMVLSEKQKQVVQQLRKELEKKQNAPSSGGGSIGSGFITPQGARVLITTQHQQILQRPSFSVCTGVQTQGLSLRVEKPRTTSQIPAVPTAAQQIIQQVVPSLVSNLVAAAANNHNHSSVRKPIPSSVLFPSLSAAKSQSSPPLKKTIGNENARRVAPSSTFLVVPTPKVSTRPISDGQSSVISSSTTTTPNFGVNISSPIRVPQYPPPLQCRQTPTACVTSTINTCTNTIVTAIVEVPKKEKKITTALNTSEVKIKSENQRQTVKLVSPKKEEPSKMNFMTALGLVNRDVLNEIQSKKVERKRRTTANPQFSNAALEEKRRNAAAALLNASSNASSGRNIKKPRGRPRVNAGAVISPPATKTPPLPKSPPTPPLLTPPPCPYPVETQPTNLVVPRPPLSITIVPVPSSPTSPNPTEVELPSSKATNPVQQPDNGLKSHIKPNLPNGCLKSMLQRNGGILTEVVLCGICHLRLGAGGGDMLACMGCKRPYHTRCAARAVPSSSNNNAPWTCPKCTMTLKTAAHPAPPAHKGLPPPPCWKKEVLPISNKIVSAKQSKEEQKHKLLKRSRELSSERSQLQEKFHRLADIAAGHFQKQVELAAKEKNTQETLKRIESVVSLVRNQQTS